MRTLINGGLFKGGLLAATVLAAVLGTARAADSTCTDVTQQQNNQQQPGIPFAKHENTPQAPQSKDQNANPGITFNKETNTPPSSEQGAQNGVSFAEGGNPQPAIEPGSQAGTTTSPEMTGVSVQQEQPRRPMDIKNEVLAVRPNLGAIVYNDTTASTTSRALYGLTADYNATALLTDNPQWYAGGSFGGFYSHLGSATSDFWGSSPSSIVNSGGANIVMLPINAKIGYNFTDSVRLSARGGGNVLYRSEGISMNLGSSTSTTGTIWRIYPNIGADLDILLTQGVSLGFRPDYTFTPGNNIFMGTVALGIAVG